MMGDEVYEELARYLDARIASQMPPISHPSEVPVHARPLAKRLSRTVTP